MGIDAEIGFALKVPATPGLLKEIQFELMHRLGKEFFWCTRYDASKKEYAVNFLEPLPTLDRFDGPLIGGEHLVRVGLWTRYYGPDYERGDCLKLCGTMLYLLGREDVEAVWYGGDSSGVAGEKMSVVKVHLLLAYWAMHGHHPYQRAFDREDLGKRPECSYCCQPMTRNGGGGKYASFYCVGCDEKVHYQDADFDRWVNGEDVAPPRYNGIAEPKCGPFGEPMT